MTGHELLAKWKDGPVGGSGRGCRELRADIDRLVPVHARPRCVKCEKRLQLSTTSICLDPKDDEVPHRDEGGRLITGRITKVADTPFGTRVDYWIGRLGYSGDGFFCSLRCGHSFAVEKMLRSRFASKFFHDDIVKGEAS